MSSPDKESKLAAAAEELIKAAGSYVEVESLRYGRETVDELKLLSKGVTTNGTSLTSIKVSFVDKINTLNQSILLLKKDIVLMEMNRSLEWAISNAGIGSFTHYLKGTHGNLDSTDLVRKILINFRRGMGYYITGRSLSSYSNDYSYQQKDHSEEEKKFRDVLSNQIFNLTGRKPRIDDTFAIFYE
jgi:hypothetical protein